MQTQSNKRYNAFTLIELLTVIAIIGILSAIIIPTLGKVRETAQRAVDASNLREIGKAALLFASDNNDRLPDPGIVPAPSVTAPNRYFVCLGLLAKYGGINEASLLFSKNDSLFDGYVPPGILDPSDPTRNTVHPDLLSRIPSINLVGGLKVTDPSTTPLAFTRGLTAGGTWNGVGATANLGTYGDHGGHILFLGNNVQYFKSVENKLVGTQGNLTSDLRAAIKAGGTRRIYGLDPGNSIAAEDGVAGTGL
ncbi:MAG: prepilin-type N-terminal cleavage/methylation domain-containing protein [Opitutaceae bacterium]|nr:prepilin-type N-terminal cleavage/methylation domain-containing protein [Opitutaceae bacterium]